MGEIMSDIKEVSAWAVVDNEGVILPWTASLYRKDSIDEFLNPYNYGNGIIPPQKWEDNENRGYTCIEVTIKPKENP